MKGLPRSLARASAVNAGIRKMAVPIHNLTVSVANGSSSQGYGTVALGALPVGNVLYLGAVSYLQFSTTDADITATFDGDYSIGTVGTVDADVSDGGEADLVPSTALGAATAKLSPVVRGASTDALGGGIIDNTAGSLNMNLNLLIDDASQSGAADFIVNGVVYLAFIVLGDD